LDKIKYVKLEKEDGSFSNPIPLSVDGNYIDINGNSLINELNSKATRLEVQAVASGSPLVASSISEMTQNDRVYVNTIDGKWYYYNGSS
jgi:hypothetical protein